jgi:hypothetical protein
MFIFSIPFYNQAKTISWQSSVYSDILHLRQEILLLLLLLLLVVVVVVVVVFAVLNAPIVSHNRPYHEGG